MVPITPFEDFMDKLRLLWYRIIEITVCKIIPHKWKHDSWSGDDCCTRCKAWKSEQSNYESISEVNDGKY